MPRRPPPACSWAQTAHKGAARPRAAPPTRDSGRGCTSAAARCTARPCRQSTSCRSGARSARRRPGSKSPASRRAAAARDRLLHRWLRRRMQQRLLRASVPAILVRWMAVSELTNPMRCALCSRAFLSTRQINFEDFNINFVANSNNIRRMTNMFPRKL